MSLAVLFCRIGYPVPMFVGFCIMFSSTISKCLVFAFGAWVTGRVLMAVSPELRTQIPGGGGEVGKKTAERNP